MAQDCLVISKELPEAMTKEVHQDEEEELEWIERDDDEKHPSEEAMEDEEEELQWVDRGDEEKHAVRGKKALQIFAAMEEKKLSCG